MRPWIAERAAATPHRPALSCGGSELDWAALAARATDAARRLRALGLGPGERLALLLPNGVAFVELAHAAALCGAALVPLNVRLTPRELAFQLADSQPRVLVHGGGALAAAAREASAALPQLERVLAREDGGPALGDLPPGAGGPLEDSVDLEATCAVVYTSGTTGAPKGAELSFASFLWSAAATAFALGSLPSDRWLACLPLFHVGGLAILWRSVLGGASVAVHERFDAAAAARALDEDGITLVSLVAATLAALLDERGERRAPPALRCALVGGGPAPRPLLERAGRLGFPVVPTYGLTETASMVTVAPLDEAGTRFETAGRALPGSELRVVGDGGEVLPPGVPGGIEVRGPTLMKGYLGRPAETAAALRGGWLRTGDVGVLGADGELRVLDRRSDLVVSGGENVYPAEVEGVLASHPAVAEAAVAGEPDERFGQRVAAWVVLRPGARAEPGELERFCREHLAGYKVPRRVHLVAALPRSASGKLLRRALAAPAPAGDPTRDVDPR